MTSIKELNVVNPHEETDNASQLSYRIKKAVKELRTFYYQRHPEEPLAQARAFGGKPTESIGAFVEYNLKTIHCVRSAAGLCTPCFYSKFPNAIDTNHSEKYQLFLKNQIDYILDNFDECILSKQIGKSYYRVADLHFPQNEPISCCITPIGSFFDEKEMPTCIRQYLLKRLINISASYQRDVILYVESHVKDFNKYIVEQATSEELDMLRRLHIRIVFGFESKDNFVRNVLYGKNLSLEEFENAVRRAQKEELGTYAFTFVGLYPMTHFETLSDVKNSFLYLKQLNVIPVVMFANVQEYTLADVLIQSGQYKLISPITVIEVVNLMLSIFGRIRDDGYDAWLMADPVGGPPEPVLHIFTDPATNCCSEKIYSLIKELRIDHEFRGFNNIYEQVSTCSLHKESTRYLYEREPLSLLERTELMIEQIEQKSKNYLQNLRKNELLHAKAHLLCEGVSIDNKTKDALEKIGIEEGFIHSTNMLLDDQPVNAYLMEKLVPNPACELSYQSGKFYLRYSSADSDSQPELIGEVKFLPIPEWGEIIIDGYRVSDYLRPHSNNCISIWPNQKCCYGDLRCKFCSLLKNGICLKPETVVKMIVAALKTNPLYEVHLSGGVYKSISENIGYYASIANAIHKEYPNAKISLETIPPLSKEGLQCYKESGVSSVLMNIELANESVRRRVCPGKSIISRERYIQSYREAVAIFGKWNVGSVVMFGIEGVSNEDIITLVRQLCEIGVYPVIMPFQPIKDSEMHDCKASNPDDFLVISEQVGQIINEMSMGDKLCTFGCINCGACSVENGYLLEYT